MYRWPPSGFGALSGINRLKKQSSDETASPRKPTHTGKRPLEVSLNEGAVALSTAVSGRRGREDRKTPLLYLLLRRRALRPNVS